MARSRRAVVWSASSSLILACILALPEQFGATEAMASASGGGSFAPGSQCTVFEQGAAAHVFDTSGIEDGPHYVNDHTIIQAADGTWHLFGIFHREPFGDAELDFIHAIADEPEPSRWTNGAFIPAPDPYRIALRADSASGETHIWAPHVIEADGRYLMVYQGGGRENDHASIRLAESDDLYRWSRVGEALFDDICEARDPMLERRDGGWVVYYTRCDSISRRVSGVAYRSSRDLLHWSEPRMALTLHETTPAYNSGYTESPFIFERGGYYYLSVTSYPIAWDATDVYRSRTPFEFGDLPFTRLRAHAAEWVVGRNGRTWITHAGAGQRGVWMSPVRATE